MSISPATARIKEIIMIQHFSLTNPSIHRIISPVEGDRSQLPQQSIPVIGLKRAAFPRS